MQKNKQCCIMWFVDHDKKTYNPGLIMTDDATDQEISEICCRMQDEGRRVNNFASHVVDCVSQLPPLDQPIAEHPLGYKYDPYLIW